MTIITDLLIWLGKTLGSKVLGRFSFPLRLPKLVFTKVSGKYCYSHYIGQNHVREGGNKQIYEFVASLTIFNKAASARILRELTLHCTINGVDHPLCLFDQAQQQWQENYHLPGNTVTSYCWTAVPPGNGVSMWLGSPGLIPIHDNDLIELFFSYLDERNRFQRIEVGFVTAYRLPKEQIAC